MLPLLATLATGLLLLWGGYRLGQRSSAGALCGAGILLLVAWRLAHVDTSHGEGAAVGVAIIPFLVWSFAALSLLLATSMLVGAIRAHDSLAAKIALGILIPVAALVLAQRSGAGASPLAPSRPPASSEPRALRLEGYAWAIDQGVMADSLCHGDDAFVEGCKAGVARNQGR